MKKVSWIWQRHYAAHIVIYKVDTVIKWEQNSRTAIYISELEDVWGKWHFKFLCRVTQSEFYAIDTGVQINPRPGMGFKIKSPRSILPKLIWVRTAGQSDVGTCSQTVAEVPSWYVAISAVWESLKLSDNQRGVNSHRTLDMWLVMQEDYVIPTVPHYNQERKFDALLL